MLLCNVKEVANSFIFYVLVFTDYKNNIFNK